MLALLIRHWRPLAVILALVLVWLHGHSAGAGNTEARWQAMYSKQEAQHAQALQRAEAHAREVEQGWAAAMDATTTALIQENQDVAAHRDRLLAARRAGRLHLPTACPARVPEAAPGPAGGDAATGGGIPRPAGGEDFAEFLIQEAARADQIAAQLAACQDAHRAIRP